MALFPRALMVIFLLAVVKLLSPVPIGHSFDKFFQKKERDLKTRLPINHLPGHSKRWAIVIGVDNYDDPQISPLTGAVNDAKAIRNALVQYAGFPEDQVILLASDQPIERRPTRNNIIQRLSNILNLMPKDGLLLVSFAGHGTYSGRDFEGRAFLLPSDARIGDVFVLEQTAVDVNNVREAISKSGLKQVIIILDSCRNDPGGRSDSINPLTEEFAKSFDFASHNKNIEAFVIFYATKVGERAYEYTEKKQGYFTWFLIEGLSGKAANEQGYVTLGSLRRYLENKVPKQVSMDLGPARKQHPFVENKGYRDSELIISVIPQQVANNITNQPKNSGIRSEELFWESIHKSTDPEDFREYLRKYPSGNFVGLAQRRLKSIEATAKANATVETERIDWREIENSTNPEDFRNYISVYGTKGLFYNQAQIKLNNLEALKLENGSYPGIISGQ